MSESEQFPNPTNLAFVEELYIDYLRDPAGVPDAWRAFFDAQGASSARAPAAQLGPTFRPASIFNPPAGGNGRVRAGAGYAAQNLQDRVDQMVRAYRVRGHRIAHIDPLGRPRPNRPELKPKYYGFTKDDLHRRFSCRTISGAESRTLREILGLMRDTYCRFIGVQFMHIDDFTMRHWLQDRMEATRNRISLTRNQQLRILTRLTDAVIFEEFIQKKFIGAKSFSLEGAESLIPLLELAIEKAGTQNISEMVIGMAHRGRLNVLANILGKSSRQIFREFADIDAEAYIGRGDVKYHQGYHGDWQTTAGHTVHLALCFNPSHLEFVNPVVLGRIRAKQDRLGDVERAQGMALIIHGDAAFAGEGIVQETLNLSRLGGYRVGGALHVIVNNQIGFTTNPEDGRSTVYATDIARMLQSPILHVNGENPEAVAAAIDLAMDFRAQFQRDVVIDMYSFRRRGHNEGDEPAFTQPKMYKKIRSRPSVRQSYLNHMLRLGGVTREEADKISERRREQLEKELSSIEKDHVPVPQFRPSLLGRIWSNYRGGSDENVPEVDTGVTVDRLRRLGERMLALPEDFSPHRKIERLLSQRAEMIAGEKPLDWATGELLAFASLAAEGTRVRLSGQDSRRGTFSQRHAVLYDTETERAHHCLSQVADGQAPVEICNSPLSEAGVLGFDYGYSIAYPDALVLWEAQFGDFCNAAQVIIDQFIASAEDKWHSLSGLVMLLPHGLEGQGPEHSSARPERFLMLAAEDNLQLVSPTTPAQYFHVLRRQVLRRWRKPLIVLTPKSLLRSPAATSPLEAFGTGRFERILGDERAEGGKTKRLLLCNGKVYYDLVAKREEWGRDDVAIVRLEQLYPLKVPHLKTALGDYGDDITAIWVQEEPENMGAWPSLRLRFGEKLLGRWSWRVVSRPASASPATGSAASHRLEQERLLEQAFNS